MSMCERTLPTSSSLQFEFTCLFDVTKLSKRMLLGNKSPYVAVAAMFFLNGGLFGAWASRVPTIKSTFELSPDQLGLLLLFLAAGAIISFPLAGEATNRIGACSTTRVLAIAHGVGLVAIGLSPNPIVLAVALFLFGMAHGAMDVTMNAWGAEVEQAGSDTILPSLHAMWSFGAAFGAVAGSLALWVDLSLLFHFFVFALLITASCWLVANIEWQSIIVGKSDRNLPFVFPRGVLVFVGLVAFSAAVSEGAMADWSAVFLVETVDASEEFAALGYAVFSFFMVITRLLGGRIIGKFGVVTAARLSGAIAFVGIALAMTGYDRFVVVCGFACMGVGLALLMPMAFSRAASQSDQPSGTAIASVATLGYGGMLLGPPILGFLADRLSFQLSFGFLAMLALVIIVLSGYLKQKN